MVGCSETRRATRMEDGSVLVAQKQASGQSSGLQAAMGAFRTVADGTSTTRPDSKGTATSQARDCKSRWQDRQFGHRQQAAEGRILAGAPAKTGCSFSPSPKLTVPGLQSQRVNAGTTSPQMNTSPLPTPFFTYSRLPSPSLTYHSPSLSSTHHTTIIPISNNVRSHPTAVSLPTIRRLALLPPALAPPRRHDPPRQQYPLDPH